MKPDELPKMELPADLRAELDNRTGSPALSAALVEALQELDDDRLGEAAMLGFRFGLRVCRGPEVADLIWADLTGRASESNAAWAKIRGRSRASASRTLTEVRRRLGMPPRVPGNARPGGTATKSTKTETNPKL